METESGVDMQSNDRLLMAMYGSLWSTWITIMAA